MIQNDDNKIINNNLNSLEGKKNKEPLIYKIAPILTYVVTLPILVITLKSVFEGKKDFEEVWWIIILICSLLSTTVIYPMLRLRYKRKIAERNAHILQKESQIANNNLEQATPKSKKNICTCIMVIIFLTVLVLSIMALKSVLEGRKDFDEVAHIIIPAVIIMNSLLMGPMLSKRYKRKKARRAQLHQQIKL